MAQEPIWPGSGSAVSGNTPFGFYDEDTVFQTDAPKFALWAAKRMGYPITAIELQDSQFYACFEESITEYSSQVNQFNIKDNLLSLKGQPTSSNLTHKRLTDTMAEQIFLSETYGSEAQVGGTVPVYKEKIQIDSGSQDYNLNTLIADKNNTGAIQVTKVFYEASPAISRYFDPYAGTGNTTNNLLDGFGFGGASPAITFVLQPVYADLLKTQAIEFNDQIRKSGYSFELKNNNLRIFPPPATTGSLWLEYSKVTEKENVLRTRYSGSVDTISDISNAPFNNMTYKQINDVGKTWCRKYGLALSKELLGMVRSKYGTIPIPNSDVTLDGETLRAEATAEKDQLMEQLREMLDQTSNKALLEADQASSDSLQEKMKKVPMPIFIG